MKEFQFIVNEERPYICEEEWYYKKIHYKRKFSFIDIY